MRALLRVGHSGIGGQQSPHGHCHTGDTWATLSAKDFATPPILPQFGNIGTGTSTCHARRPGAPERSKGSSLLESEAARRWPGHKSSCMGYQQEQGWNRSYICTRKEAVETDGLQQSIEQGWYTAKSVQHSEKHEVSKVCGEHKHE